MPNIEQLIAEENYSALDDELILGSPDSDIIDLLMDSSDEDDTMMDLIKGEDDEVSKMIDLLD